MKMNHFVIPAFLMLGMTAACVESTPSLQIEGAAPQNEDCTFPDPDQVKLLRGSVDLGFSAGFPLVFAVTSNLESTSIEVGDQPVGGDEDLNTIYITEHELSYASSPSLDIPQPDGPVRLYGTVGVDGQVLLNLLTFEAYDFLSKRIGGDGQPASVELLVTMRLRGQRVAGDEIESNEITYPITVSNSSALELAALEDAVCPGQQFAPREACDQRGLNGVLPGCEDIPEPPPAP